MPSHTCKTITCISPSSESGLGTIHLVRTQHFPQEKKFLPPDTYIEVSVSRGKTILVLQKILRTF